MLPRLRDWLGRIPSTDPFERRSAVVLQVFFIGLSAFLVVTEAGRVIRTGALVPPHVYGVLATWGSVAASLAAVVLIRLGRARRGFVVVIATYLAFLAGSLVFRGLGYHEALLVRVHGILLVLPALLLGRRALWAVLTTLLSAMLLGWWRDLRLGPQAPGEAALGVWTHAVAVMVLLAIILDRFGAALREAYSEARTRQTEAERAKESLVRANQSLSEEMQRRAKAESLLYEAQKLEAIGRLAGGLAHDINNVLTAILGFADMVKPAVPQGSTARDDLDQIGISARRAGALTRNLLAFARRQIVEPRPVRVESRIRSLEPMLARLIGENIRIQCLFADPPWTVLIDPVQLDQVLVNLAVNARDASPQGGILTFETERLTIGADDGIVALGLPPGDHVRLSVTDTGTGMDVDELARVFEPYFTTKSGDKGTGLGLATCYGIVRQAGGVMRARSQVGRGTTFEITFPRTEDTLESTPAPSPALTEGGGETILVVEDDPRILDIATRTLRAQGHEVLAACDTEQALTEAAAYSGDIALLVTDVVLPDVNGSRLAEQLRRTRPGMAVLYVSGYSDNVIAQGGILDPGVHLLPKPFSPGALALKVRQVLDRRSGDTPDSVRA